MYTETFSQMKKQLGQLDKWLGTAAEHAKAKVVRSERLVRRSGWLPISFR